MKGNELISYLHVAACRLLVFLQVEGSYVGLCHLGQNFLSEAGFYWQRATR